jgi:hypothetical protein
VPSWVVMVNLDAGLPIVSIEIETENKKLQEFNVVERFHACVGKVDAMDMGWVYIIIGGIHLIK